MGMNKKSRKSDTKSWLRTALTIACIAVIAILLFYPFSRKKTADGQKTRAEEKIAYTDIKPDVDYYEAYFKKDFSKEKKLLDSIRRALVTGGEVDVEEGYNFEFDPEMTLPRVSLYQEGNRFIGRGSIRDSLKSSLDRIIIGLREHERFDGFDVADPSKTRILFEIVQSEHPVRINDLVFSYDGHKGKNNKLKTNRFEPGITGLKCSYKDRTHYYMPTDAATLSHLSHNHVLGYLTRKMKVAPGEKSRSKRIKALKKLNLTCQSLTSKAFITFEDGIIPLYRAHPAVILFSKDRIRQTMLNSVDWLIENMNDDGSFLYYYDPIADTIVDHAHSDRTVDNLYNNMLRHSGGTITLLRAYELTKKQKYLDAAKRSLDFLVNNTRKRDINGKTAYYEFYNDKAKLGGTGVGLASIMRYYMVSGDDAYNEYATGMVRHLLSRIEDDGEMIGYYIHPSFRGGSPIMNPTEQEKKILFSFYYPGEALLGLALYEREMKIDPDFRKEIQTLCKRALDFLVDIRPQRYADQFTALPSDGWLMQAVEEWSKNPQFQRQAYVDFVYKDADAMVDHMYNHKNSLYFDYPGTFFYNYGDHAYTDGARAEGLVAAYYLADRTGRTELARKYRDACVEVAGSLLYTYNSPESAFAFIHPEKAIKSFRFKFTRQWVRVDSVQHTACFYARLFMAP